MNDPALVDAMLARVPGAASFFIDRHDTFLRKTVQAASPGSASLVGDLTHDAYVHLWGNDFRVLRQWQRVYPLRGYLHTVITRLVWAGLGRLQPVWEVVDADPFAVAGANPEPCAHVPTPEDEVVANEMVRVVRDALGRLDQSHSRVLELRFTRDLSYREIGKALGITSNNAGVRISRALARLKSVLPPFTDSSDWLASSGPMTARM